MALRSFAFNVAFSLVMVVISLAGLPLFLGPPRWASACGRAWGRACLWLLRVIVGLSYEIRGDVPVGAVLVAAKHQSAWETLALAAVLEQPAFVLKRMLLLMPPFGPYLAKAGMIAIDRSGGASAIRKMLTSARAVFAAGRPIVIFPEGTRRMPGAPPAYHPGVAALYRDLQTPVIPVALNSGLYWSKNALAKRPGRIIMEFLPAIPPGMRRRLFMSQLEDAIETATVRLVQEGEQHGGVIGQ